MKGMSDQTTEDQFKTNMIDLSLLMYELLQYADSRGYKVGVEPAMMRLATEFIKTLDQKRMIESFIEHSHVHWDAIRKRDEQFFFENSTVIFGRLPVSESTKDSFKTLYTLKDASGQEVVGKDDRDAIWEFFESLVRLSIKHVHRGREPFLKVVGSERVPKYRKEFFRQVKLEHHAREWGVKLDFKE